MKIAVLGKGKKAEAWKAKNLDPNSYTWVQDTKSNHEFDIFIDLEFDECPQNLLDYLNNSTTIFMVSAVNINLETAFHKISRKPMSLKIIGFNALPTMVERDTIEFSNPYGIENLELVFTELGYTNHTKVDSRIGMVTPRIIAMIINEAFYTVQEGTATERDIDTAMKLGVNYPKGPFEFLEKIGVEYVYRILEAIYEDTKEERYKICPALKKAYLNL
jgi:3-hydroxybutyryl-CoA dehydrogenase